LNDVIGKLISLEGVDGAGKTTHLEYLCDYLVKRQVTVLTTREPGGTHVGEQLRSILLDAAQPIAPLTELLMMFAARAEHIQKVIRPALLAGTWVLCDRFTDATYAYQGGGRGINSQNIEVLEHMTQGNLRPDLTFLLDLPVEVGLRRRRGLDRSRDRFESQDLEFKQRVRLAYLERSETEPRILCMDGTLPIETIQHEMGKKLGQLFEESAL
jgi:dTMP kinase